jgi:hypothetical protein
MDEYDNLKAITWRRSPSGRSVVTFEYYTGPSSSEELDEAGALAIAKRVFWEYRDEGEVPGGRRWTRSMRPSKRSHSAPRA